MKYFTKVKILWKLLMICLFTATGILQGASAKAEDGFRITTTRPVEGQALNVAGGQVEQIVKWFVDGKEAAAGEQGYVPVAADYEKWIRAEAYDKNGDLVGKDQIYFSKLPVLYMNTENGEEVTTKTEYKNSTLRIQGNTLYDQQYDGQAQVKLRGNSSIGFPQKPYKIKLGKGTNLFGFGKNKHWVLLSSFMDQCALRNRIGSDLSAWLGLTNMQMTWVDVVINDSYAGMYTLSEQIRIGESRVDILDWEEEAENAAKKIYKSNPDSLMKEDKEKLEELLCSDFSWVTSGACIYRDQRYEITKDPTKVNITGGYLFELSDEYDELSKFMTSNGLKVMLKAPEYLYTNEDMMSYVQDYWNRFEQSIQSVDGYNGQGEHYSQLADFDSMVGYWLTMEIMGNDDASRKSRYAYKDKDGILEFGPVWDFDWGCGSYTVGTNAAGWKVSIGTLWKDFMDDPYFQIKAGEYYWQVHNELEKLVADGGTIDTYINYLAEAGQANDARYPYVSYGDAPMRKFASDAQAFKQYMKERIAWLDQVFADEDAATFNMYIEGSCTPYTRAWKEMPIRLDNGAADEVSPHMAADGFLKEGEDAQFTVDTASSAVCKLAVYVNGLHRGDYEITGQSGSFSVDSKYLTGEKGTYNVVSVLGCDEKGNVIYKNYVTVVIPARQFTIYFDSCSGSAVSAITADYGSELILPEDPVRQGYQFCGWYLDQEGTQQCTLATMPAVDMTLYAKWELLATPEPSDTPKPTPWQTPEPVRTPASATESPCPSDTVPPSVFSDPPVPETPGVATDTGNGIETMPSLSTTVPEETGKPAAAPHKKIKLIKKIKKGRKKNTIFWKKVKGADGYCVYVAHGRKNSSKKYTSFRCIKTTRKTKAVHKGVKKDIWYRYRVDAYCIRRGKKIVVASSRYVCIRNRDFSCKNSA